MNDFILVFLNAAGANAGLAALWISLQAVLLVGVLLVVDRLLRHRTRAALRYGLWMLVLLKFVLPPDLLSPTSLAYWIAPRLAEPVRLRTFESAVTTPIAAPDSPTAVPSTLPGFVPETPRLRLPGFLALVWLAGIAGWTSWVWVRSRRMSALVRTSTPAMEPLCRLLQEVAPPRPASSLPEVRLTDSAQGPALFGLFRPVILLPKDLPGRIGPEALAHVLRHELVHQSRRDPWFHLFQVVVQVLWWWNPIVWLLNARIRALREEAVDEAVMLAPDSDSYPSTLVAVARHCATPSRLSLAFLGILESRSRLEKRVRRLVEVPLPRRARFGWAGWASVLLAGALFLPMGFARRVEAQAEPPKPSSRLSPPTGAATTSKPDSAVISTLPPELARRYGLVVSTNTPPLPAPKSIQPTPMPPEMARRYGLLPATQQAPAPAGSPAPAASAPGLPTRQQVVTWAQSVDEAGNPPAQGLPSKQQVLIESRFLEFPADQLERLVPELGTRNSLRIPEARAAEVLKELERPSGMPTKFSFSLLSAPRVVTALNTGAEISVQGEQKVRIATSKGTEETTVMAGPRLQFTVSEVPRNPNALALTADATVVQVLGDPESQDDTLGRHVVNNVGTGSARLWDRQSLLLDAGTFTNRVRFVDKVPTLGDIPLLGRLFRTEGTQDQIRRILVLLTPTFIDPAGNPVNDPKRLPFDPGTFPPEN